MFLTLDKDESSWEVLSSTSSKNVKGYSQVMTRLLKQSKQLTMVMNYNEHFSVFWEQFFFINALIMKYCI